MITNLNTRGSKIIYWIVVSIDILAMVTVMLVYWQLDKADIPPQFVNNKYDAIYICLISGLLSELIFSPMIHRRRIKAKDIISRVLSLSLMQGITFAILAKFNEDRGGEIIHFAVWNTVFLFITLTTIRFLERLALNLLRSKGHNHRHVIFIGSDPANAMIYRDMINDPSKGFNVMGYYSNGTMENISDDFEKLGTRDELIRALRNHEHPFKADEVYCSLSHDNNDDIRTIMEYCEHNVIQFYYVPRIYGNLTLNLTPIHYGTLTLFTNHDSPLNRLENKILKRAFDLVFSTFVCLFLLPLLPIIWFIQKRQSPGPLFFKQERTGINGRSFVCYKFRSMHVNNTADTAQATKNDPRKYPFGEFMRKTNIDELPQFFNVLKGDMSVVGPRPHMLYHTDKYSELIDKYMVRHFSKPGITGWAQVTGYRGETRELWQMEERIKRDIWYNENWTFWLDIDIIVRTILSVFKHDENAY